jgi:hypothetical protein
LERELLKGVCVKGRKPTQSLHPQKKKKKVGQSNEEVRIKKRWV